MIRRMVAALVAAALPPLLITASAQAASHAPLRAAGGERAHAGDGDHDRDDPRPGDGDHDHDDPHRRHKPQPFTTTLRYLGGGPVLFSVRDMSDPALRAQPVSFELTYATSRAGRGGAIELSMPPALPGVHGDGISRQDFAATCVQSGGFGRFTSLGTVHVSAMTPCATYPAGATGQLQFTVVMQLDDTAHAPVPFPADVYGPCDVFVAAVET